MPEGGGEVTWRGVALGAEIERSGGGATGLACGDSSGGAQCVATVSGCAEAMAVEPPLPWASSGGGEVAQGSDGEAETAVDETVGETRMRGSKRRKVSGNKRARKAGAAAER